MIRPAPGLAAACAVASALLLAACNGTESSGEGGTGTTPGGSTADPIADIQRELALGDGTVDLEEGMEAMEDLFYEEAWDAMDAGDTATTARTLVRVHHLLTHAKLKPELAGDARFTKMLQAAAADTLTAARLAVDGDGAKLRTAMETLDKQRCIACHKIYRKED